MMDAVVITGHRCAALQRVERWRPVAGEALVRCNYTAVCSAERRMFTRESTRYPVIGGHEIAGVVDSIEGGDDSLKPGDRVVVDAVKRCGRCFYCRKGQNHRCVEMMRSEKRDGFYITGGGFAEYTVAPVERIFKVPDHVDMESASLVEPLACCLHSIRKSQLVAGETTVIIGAGPMGIMHMMLAQLEQAESIVIDVDDERLEFATRFGAGAAINADRLDCNEYVREHTNGRGADVVIVAANNRAAGELGIDIAGRLGRVVLFTGMSSTEPFAFDWNRIHYNEVQIIGTQGKTDEEFGDAVELLSEGKVELHSLISKRILLSELPGELGVIPAGNTQRVVVRHGE